MYSLFAGTQFALTGEYSKIEYIPVSCQESTHIRISIAATLPNIYNIHCRIHVSLNQNR